MQDHVDNKYLELVKPEGVDHEDDIEKEVAGQAREDQRLSRESGMGRRENVTFVLFFHLFLFSPVREGPCKKSHHYGW